MDISGGIFTKSGLFMLFLCFLRLGLLFMTFFIPVTHGHQSVWSVHIYIAKIIVSRATNPIIVLAK